MRGGGELFEFRVEGIVCLLLVHRGQWSVARADDGMIRQGEDFLPIGREGIGIRDHAATHRTCEKGIANHRDWLLEAVDDVGDPAAGVAPGGPWLDAEAAHRPCRAVTDGEGLRIGLRFTVMAEDGFATRRSAQFVQISDVITVSVGDEDHREAQIIRREKVDHRLRICTGVKSDGCSRCWVPGDVGIHRHIVVSGIELGQSTHLDGLWQPRLLSHRYQRGAVELEAGGDFQQGSFVCASVFQLRECRLGNSGLFDELGIADFEATLGFAEHILGKVFEGDHVWVGRELNGVTQPRQLACARKKSVNRDRKKPETYEK